MPRVRVYKTESKKSKPLTTSWSAKSSSNISKSESKKPTLPTQVIKTVEDRGFYLYNWISPEEFRLSFREDYLTAISNLSTPFLTIALIWSAIGYFTSFPLAIIWALGVFWVMYFLIFCYLFYKALQKWNLYAKGANVTLTDTHLVAWDMVTAYQDKPQKSKLITSLETEFDERLFWASNIEEKIKKRKEAINEKLTSIIKVVAKIGDNSSGKQLGNLIMILAIVWILYGTIFWFVYYIGLFFVSLFARWYAFIIDMIMRWKQKTEYKIQKSFLAIDTASNTLKNENKKAKWQLQEAIDNKWMNNLGKRIEKSFQKINTSASTAIDTHLKLKNILLNSKYKEIFSFEKYEHWIKTQVTEPLQKTIDLLKTNKHMLEESIKKLGKQIENMQNPWHKAALEAQKSRLEMQVHTTQKTLTSLHSSLNSLI